jgi:hemolysin-activating ACP:hemolysin acyltransferase
VESGYTRSDNMLVSNTSNWISIDTMHLEGWDIPFGHIKDCATSLCNESFVVSLFSSAARGHNITNQN